MSEPPSETTETLRTSIWRKITTLFSTSRDIITSPVLALSIPSATSIASMTLALGGNITPEQPAVSSAHSGFAPPNAITESIDVEKLPTSTAPTLHVITGPSKTTAPVKLVHLANTVILIRSIPSNTLVLRSNPVAEPNPAVQAKPARRLTLANKNGYTIPVEIYLLILSLLDTPELVSMLRVSRFFHFLLAPTLYRTLYSIVDIALPNTTSPLSIRGIPIPSREVIAPAAQRVLKSSVDSSAQPHRLASSVALVMPHIKTLRIRPNGSDHGISLCLGFPDTTCPLIANLPPSQLIIGGGSTGLSGSFAGLWSTGPLPFPPPFVTHLVVLVGLFTLFDLGEDKAASIFRQMPGTVEKATFVLSCAERAWDNLSDVGNSAIDDQLDEMVEAEVIGRTAMRASVGQAGAIEVVGAGEEITAQMPAELERCLIKMGHSLTVADKRSKAVVFITDETFEERDGWFAAQRAESKEVLVEKVLGLARAVAGAREAAALQHARMEQARLEQVRQDEEDDCVDYDKHGMCDNPDHDHRTCDDSDYDDNYDWDGY